MEPTARLLRNYAQDDGAATVIEYALIAAATCLAIATVMPLIGASVEAMFGKIESAL